MVYKPLIAAMSAGHGPSVKPIPGGSTVAIQATDARKTSGPCPFYGVVRFWGNQIKYYFSPDFIVRRDSLRIEKIVVGFMEQLYYDCLWIY